MVAEPDNLSLNGLKLLLVRPARKHDEFMFAAANQGAVVSHLPVMNIIPVENPQMDAQVSRAEICIFVSRTAAQMAIHQKLIPAAGKWFYAVGKSTAAVLAEAGVTAQTPAEQMTSEGLLALPELQGVADKRVAIFCGTGGRELLSQELVVRGAAVEKIALYRREFCDQHKNDIVRALCSGELTAAVVHSGELMSHLLSVVEVEPQANQQLLSLPILVPGNRVAKQAKLAGFGSVIVAASALPQDMVSALAQWYSKQ